MAGDPDLHMPDLEGEVNGARGLPEMPRGTEAKCMLESLATRAALEMIAQHQVPTISSIARSINYSRTAVQNGVGTIEQLLDLAWNEIFRGLLFDWKAECDHTEVDTFTRDWANTHTRWFEFLMQQHIPSKVDWFMVVSVAQYLYPDEAEGFTFKSLEAGFLAEPTCAMWSFMIHTRARATFIRDYAGPVPPQVVAASSEAVGPMLHDVQRLTETPD